MSNELALLLVMPLALLIAWLGTGMVRRHALQASMLDIPNARSSHSVPTPRGGGLAIVVTFLVAVLALYLVHRLDLDITAALLGGGLAVAGVGYLDDRKTMPATVRFVVHTFAAIWVVALLGGLTQESLRIFGLHGTYAGAVIAVLALTWMTNLFNFMDGIDGLAASEAFFIAVAAAALGARHGMDGGLLCATLLLACAAAGFLLWNWPRARIFMGDVGSGFLGFILAALALATSARGTMPIEVWVLLGGTFVVDATVTLLRRMARGDRWFEPHRTHAYQHLARRFKAHSPVTLLVLGINILWLLPWAFLASEYPAQSRWCVLAGLGPLIVLVLLGGAGRRE